MAEAKHPPPAIESANVLSYFSFNWIQPLLIKGWVTSRCRLFFFVVLSLLLFLFALL